MSKAGLAGLGIVLAGVALAAGVRVWWLPARAHPLRIAEMPPPAFSPLAGRQRSLDAWLPAPPNVTAERAGVVVLEPLYDSPPLPTPVPALSPDRVRLGELATNYVYRAFSQFGGTRTGRLEDNRIPNGERIVSVTEGDVLEGGMVVLQLDPSFCVLALGDATYRLKRIGREIDDLLREIQENPRPLTDEEKQLAMELYNARYGDKFREYKARNPGARQLPVLTEEEQAANRAKYFLKYKDLYRKQFENYKQQLGPEADDIPSLRKFEGPTHDEAVAAFHEYLDEVERLNDVKFTEEQRRSLEARVIRTRIPFDPAFWETPYPGFERPGR